MEGTFENLVIVELSWLEHKLPLPKPNKCYAPLFIKDKITLAIKKMNNGKSPGKSGVVYEMTHFSQFSTICTL